LAEAYDEGRSRPAFGQARGRFRLERAKLFGVARRHSTAPDIVLRLTEEQARFLDASTADLRRQSDALGRGASISWRDELSLRGRVLGLWPNSGVSASGNCRILRAADGWVALNVSRPWDHDVLPALLERPAEPDDWSAIRAWVSERDAAHVVSRARLLDMAAAVHAPVPPGTPVPMRTARRWPSVGVRALDGLLIVDLSSLWAGPLVARLLYQCGASVTKVESAARPDGARQTPNFYDRLHPEGQRNVVVDLASEPGRSDLRRLLEEADVVIEASRPRALEQLGCGPDQIAARPGRVWLSITGYGRAGEGANWIAFGDDAAVAGGLTYTNDNGEPAFCGDALADPVTGILGATAVLRSLGVGGGHLVDLPLAGAAAALAAAGSPPLPRCS